MASLLALTRRSTLHTLPTQVASRVVGLLYVVVLARYLSVEEYGAYNFAIGALLILGFFCNLGLASSLQRFIPEYARLGRYGTMLRTLLFAHAFRGVASLMVLVLSYATFDAWSVYFNLHDYKEPYLALVVGAFFLFQIEYFTIAFNANFLHWATSLMQLGYTLLRFALVAVALELGHRLTAVLALEALSYLAAAWFGLCIFYRRLYRPHASQGRSSSHVEVARLARYSSYNAAVIPGNLMFSHSMDYFVIAAMANPSQLGFYALASRASKMATSVMPHNLLQAVLRPAFYHHYYTHRDDATLGTMFNSLVRLISCFLFPCVAVALAVADPLIVQVFGEEYRESVPSFGILLAFMLFTVLEFPSDMVLQAIEKVQARLYAQVFAVYNVVLATVLLRSHGIEGVAVATGTASMLKCLFFYRMVCHYTTVRVHWAPLAKLLAISSIAGCVGYCACRSFDETSGWMGLLLAPPLVGVSYLALFAVTSPLGQDEKQMINQFLKRRVFRV